VNVIHIAAAVPRPFQKAIPARFSSGTPSKAHVEHANFGGRGHQGSDHGLPLCGSACPGQYTTLLCSVVQCTGAPATDDHPGCQGGAGFLCSSGHTWPGDGDVPQGSIGFGCLATQKPAGRDLGYRHGPVGRETSKDPRQRYVAHKQPVVYTSSVRNTPN
jgi:hypothetical protein